MMNISQSSWIEGTYYDEVGFLKAKDCNFKKENFKQELEQEIKLITDIQEGYYRIKKSDFLINQN